MILTAAWLVQAAVLASNPAPQAPKTAPIRVWRADSIVYIALREPGHVLLLHVDAIGRIRVLFPAAPDDSTPVSADAPLAVPLPPVAEGNPATFVAVRTRWPFAWGALRSGSEWDYATAWLLQPTAGDPLAALLDIADRVTDSRPYDYGQVTYSGRGAVVARGPAVQPEVCFTCYRHASAAPAPPTVATNSVDCTNASLTNSFCGVNSGSVSITSVPQAAYQPAPPPAPAAVYVPYYLPVFVHGGRARFEHTFPRVAPPPPPPAPPPSVGVAYPIAPQLIVPSGSQLRTLAGRRP